MPTSTACVRWKKRGTDDRGPKANARYRILDTLSFGRFSRGETASRRVRGSASVDIIVRLGFCKCYRITKTEARRRVLGKHEVQREQDMINPKSRLAVRLGGVITRLSL
ncbi:MAG TPA: hypothetical protein HPP87_09630 [Planctomycetes bacterium]|nr:hypothetical protein [Planctomycetota bacterium]HIJ71606.1 hypothetical protein [Planctomycetota bacterium]